MASVALRFIPPNERGLVKLHIWESATKEGVFQKIETTTEVGAYPTYIDSYTTAAASSVANWFAIQWENQGGAISELTAPMQGDTSSLVGILVDRILLRDPSMNEIIAAEEAEAAISSYYNVVDPYTIDATTVSPKILSGLTNLALARSYLTSAITLTQQADKWVAGIVSLDSSASSSTKNIEILKGLVDLANRDLGLSYSVKLLLKEVEVAGGYKRLAGVDLTRSIYELQ